MALLCDGDQMVHQRFEARRTSARREQDRFDAAEEPEREREEDYHEAGRG